VKTKKTSLFGNYIYSLASQLLALLAPLITAPYLARTLHEVGNGQIAFVNSIVAYFVSFAGFGFSLYGQREIAKNKDDQKTINKIFIELLYLRIIFSFIAFIALIGIVTSSLIEDKYKSLVLINSIQLLSVIFDIQFYYQGMEEFKTLAFRTIVIRSISIICVFMLVRTPDDVWIYLLYNSLAILIANIIMWPGAMKRIEFQKIKAINLKRHILPSFFIFLPILSGTIFSVLDSTMIGYLASNAEYENGCYGSALKLVNIISVIIMADGQVLASRNARDFAIKDHVSIIKHINLGFRYVWIVGFPIAIGLLLLSSRISMWFFGTGYEKVPMLLQIFTVRIITHGVMNVIGNQYLLPTGREKVCTLINFIGISSNIVLNYLLISHYGCIGAAIASVTSEGILICLYMWYFIIEHKYWNSSVLLSSWKYALAAIIMGILVYALRKELPNNLLSICLMVFTGAVVYCTALIIMKDYIILEYGKKYFNRLAGKIKNVNR